MYLLKGDFNQAEQWAQKIFDSGDKTIQPLLDAAKAGQDWKVPGFAVAIVKDDKIVFAKGYGVRDLGKPDPVDKDTLFAIASTDAATNTRTRGRAARVHSGAMP